MHSFIVMGVAGCGKSTVGEALAQHLNCPYIEGDDLHSKESVAKMSRGEALTDSDRWPWLQRIGEQMSAGAAGGSVMVASCSSLRKAYREHIQTHCSMPLAFVHLAADQQVIAERMAKRKNHFMPTSLLDSQFKTLEPLQPDETGAVIDIAHSRERVIADSIRYVETLSK